MTMSDTTRFMRLEIANMNDGDDLKKLQDAFIREFSYDFEITADFDTKEVTIDGLWDEDLDIIDVVRETGFTITYALAM